jgi:translation initiation factor IF-3
MSQARDAGLDLVEVDGNANPPVCRILDFGKWKYEQAKKEREGRKHQRGSMVHEVRMRPRTGQHDIDLKVRIAERLLAEGDKVKLSVMFRGREMSHPEVGHEVLQRALVQLTEKAGIEKPPGMEGRFLSVILTPGAKKPAPAGKGPSGPKGEGGAPPEGPGPQDDGGGPPETPAPNIDGGGPEAAAEATPEPAATGSTNES